MNSLLKGRHLPDKQCGELWSGSFAVPLTKAMHTLWSIDYKLQKSFDLDTRDGQITFAAWLNSKSEYYSGLEIQDHCKTYRDFSSSPLARIEFTCDGHVVRVPAVIVATWLMRDDLLTAFRFGSFDGIFEVTSNILLNDTYIGHLLMANEDYLLENIPGLNIPVVLYSIYLNRPDLRTAFDLETEDGVAGLCGNLLLTDEWARNLLLKGDFLSRPGPVDGIPLGYYALWLSRSDLQAVFPLSTPGGADGYLAWVHSDGCIEHPWLNIFSQEQPRRPAQSEIESEHETKCDLLPECPPSPPRQTPKRLEPGVNLLGYPFSASGLGEDLRMVARGLHSAGIPFCVLETPHDTPSARCSFEFEGVCVKRPLYNITIICLPSGELFRAFAIFGQHFFTGQYVVGQMPWELSRWPKGHDSFLGLLDEIWALTSFIRNALTPVFSGPLGLMPRAVDSTKPDPSFKRADFGIPQDSYAFLFTYDGLSMSSRKNPVDVLKAFQSAFPQTVCDVTLVFKSMHHSYDPFCAEIARMISSDKRVLFTDEIYPKPKLLALTQACDAFVSLHRAEGFGLNIAEAMLLSKPVIVSDYSGSQDFCTSETAFLVNGTEVPVPDGAYHFSEGQVWFSPNIITATQRMRYCYEHRAEASRRGEQGARHIRQNYSVERAAANYLKRYNQILADNFR